MVDLIGLCLGIKFLCFLSTSCMFFRFKLIKIKQILKENYHRSIALERSVNILMRKGVSHTIVAAT